MLRVTSPTVGPMAHLHARYVRPLLITGSVLSLLLALGPLWAVRAGTLIAVSVAVLCVVVSTQAFRRQLARERRTARRESQAQAEQLHRERQSNREVVGVLRQRQQSLRAELTEARRQIGELTDDLDGTKHANRVLADGIYRRETTLNELRALVKKRDAQIKALQVELDHAEVLALPQRHQVEAPLLRELG